MGILLSLIRNIAGAYISYMTPKTKDSRRATWKGLNFGGSIDWAVDLQKFTDTDFDAPVKRLESVKAASQDAMTP